MELESVYFTLTPVCISTLIIILLLILLIFIDSLLYQVTTDDFYADLRDNADMMRHTDTSNLPPDHECYTAARKRIPGLFKDETGGRTMYEFVALRAKSYAYDIESTVEIRAKGIRGHVIRNHLTFADHKRCLFADDDDDDEALDSDEPDVKFDVSMGKLNASKCAREVIVRIHRDAASTSARATPSTSRALPPPAQQQQQQQQQQHQQSYNPYTPYRENVSIRSYEHQLKTVKTIKLTLNRSDDKRYVLQDHVHTLAHGHYKIV